MVRDVLTRRAKPTFTARRGEPLRSALIVAAAWGLAAGGVAAQDSLSAFRLYCLETDARSAASLAAADAAGWRLLPPDRVAELARISVVEQPAGRMLRTESGVLVLLTGRTPDEGDGLTGEHCNVFSFGRGDAPDAAAVIGAWVGFPPTPKEGRFEWQFELRDGRRVALETTGGGRFFQSFGILTINTPELSRHELTRLQPAF